MKKLLLVAAAVALTAASSAGAADLSRPIVKAAPPPPIYSWTGCYVGVGGGYGLYDIQHDQVGVPDGTLLVLNSASAGKGWLATAGVGCDYQIGDRWLIGAFADVDWTNIKGDYGDRLFGTGEMGVGTLRQRWSWAAGGRIGYLVTPQLLAYFAAGFTSARYDEVNYTVVLVPFPPTGLQLPAQTFNGYFIGGGTEFAIGWFPGLFWKTEYRFADYRSNTTVINCLDAALCGAVGPFGIADRMHPYVQTVRSEVVWRFNWGGPVVAKY